jgi:hypothetical protein
MNFTKKFLLGGVLLSSSLFLSVSISAAGPLKLDAMGHLGFTGGAPRPDDTSPGSDCNVQPTGTDNAGLISFPISSTTSGCTFDFNQPYVNQPTCVVSADNSLVHDLHVSTNQQSFFIETGDGSPLISGVYYHCFAL